MSNQSDTITVGDQVRIIDQNLTAEVIDVREFDGRVTYVVHTEKGRRIVVSQRQLEKI